MPEKKLQKKHMAKKNIREKQKKNICENVDGSPARCIPKKAVEHY